MKLSTALVAALGCIILSCSGSGTPVLPNSDGDSRALALYTVILGPVSITNCQGRNAQTDHDVLQLVQIGVSE